MNDICKGKIRERLIDSLKKEGLPVNAAGGLLRVNPTYLSMVKNEKLWGKIPEKDWEVLQRWCNSGKGIVAYSNAGGVVASQNVASEQKIQDDTVVIAETPVDISKEAYVISDVKSEPEEVESVPIVKESVPEPKKPETKASIPDLIELLKEERSRVMVIIEAIDVLLNLYEE